MRHHPLVHPVRLHNFNSIGIMSRARFRNRFRCVLPLVFVAALLFAGETTLRAQEGFTVRKIEFTGNHAFSKGELILQMITREQPGLLKRLFIGDKEASRFSRNILETDSSRILTFYRTEGFLDAEISGISLRIDEDDDGLDGSVDITIHIREHQPIQVGSVDYHLELFAEKDQRKVTRVFEKLKPRLQLRSGERYRDATLQSDRQLIARTFTDAGFPFVKIIPEPALLRKEHRVDFIIHVKPGPECMFGDIRITGNDKIPAQVIRRQLALKENTLYSNRAVKNSQIRIYQLGAFQFVSIKVLTNEMQDFKIPIQVVVKEAPRLTTKFALGWGLEDQFRGYIDVTKIGPLGGARRLNLFLKHSYLEPLTANLRWTEPAFLFQRTSLTVNPFYRDEREEAYRVRRIGGTLSLLQSFARYSSSYLNYAFEQSHSIGSSVAADELTLYNKSSLTYGLTRDSSGPIFSPTHGMYTSATATVTGLGFNSVSYLRFILEGRRYHELVPGTVFAYRLKLGVIHPFRENQFIPREERFYAGGSRSVRGWRRLDLGPKDSEGIPIGGTNYLDGSLELRFPVWRELSAATFLDFGNVWNGAYDALFRGNGGVPVHFAGGFGLRIKTPVGPIRFDLGTEVFRGKPDWRSGLQIHLSIGEAF